MRYSSIFSRLSICLALLGAGAAACLGDPGAAEGSPTSVAVLTSSGGGAGPGATTPGSPLQTEDGTGPQGNDAVGPVPAYPSRDANIGIDAMRAWQTLMATHWGAADRVNESWTCAQMLETLATQLELTANRQFVGLAETFWMRLAAGDCTAGAQASIDNQAFMALALAHLYRVSEARAFMVPHRAQFLSEAQARMALVLAAEAQDGNGTSQGIWYDAARTVRATAGHGSAALAALQLYAATQNANHLAFAARVFDAAWAATVDPTTFTVRNAVSADGSVDGRFYTYNAGLLIDVAAGLHEATGSARYLRQARQLAAAMLGTAGMTVGGRLVLTEPSCTGGCGLNAMYRGIALRALAHLAALDGNNTAVQAALNGTAAAIVASRGADGHFAASWAQPSGTTSETAADLSATLALGTLALSAPQTVPLGLPPNRAHAAEGLLVGLLPVLPGGDGRGSWALAGSFTASGQSVTLPFFAPTAGAYALSLRYSMPASSSTAASLTASLAGASGSWQPSFASTGSPTAMASTPPSTVLASAGSNTVTLATSAPPVGVQLDQLTATPLQTLTGNTCTPSSTLAPSAPGPGARVCGTASFAWSGGGAQARHDVFVDGTTPACSAGAGETRCTSAPGALASGVHTYWVAEDGCSISAVGAFELALRAPSLGELQVSAESGGTRVRWPAVAEPQRVDVLVDGALVCGQTLASSCLIEAATLAAGSSHAVVVMATNACGQVRRSKGL